MSYLDVYIGWLDDPAFSMEGGNWNGNVPTRQSPFFPGGHSAFHKLVQGIGAGAYRGRQVDWGGWVAPMSVPAIRSFIAECHPEASEEDPAFTELLAFVDGLDPDGEYALVATEL